MTGAPDVPAAVVDRARWELAIDAAEIGTFDLDPRTGVLQWDDRLIALFGYDPDTFDGTMTAFYDRVHPDDRERVRTAVDETVSGGPNYDIEYRIVLPNGGIRWVQARGRMLRDQEGRPVRFLGASFDSTTVREGEARFGRLVEAMSTAFLSVDLDWRLTYVNAEAEQLIGRPRDTVLGRPIFDAIPQLRTSPIGEIYRRAQATGQVQTYEGPTKGHPDSWYRVNAHPTPEGLSIFVVDLSALQVARQLVELEARVGEQLARSLDLRSAVRELARLVVPRLGDWSIVSALAPEGGVRDVATWHVDPALRPVAERYAQVRFDGMGDEAPVYQVSRTREPRVVQSGLTELMMGVLGSAEAKSTLRQLAPESTAIVPLVARGQLIGILTVCRGANRAPLRQEEVAVTINVARRAAMALDNTRLFADQRETAARLQVANRRLREVVRHERGVARALQDAMLTRLPRTATVELQARYLAAGNDVQVGGDWYDAVMLPDGEKVLVIGDVVGHDIRAAALMGQLRNLLRGFAWDHHPEPPADTVARLDRAIRDLGLDTLATLIVARVAAGVVNEPRTVEWTSAGHPPPILVEPDGSARYLESAPDPLLGVLPDIVRHNHSVVVRPASTLLLYTDGLVEQRGVDLDERRAQLLAAAGRRSGAPLSEMLDALTAELVAEANSDDVAILGARFTAPR